MAVRRIIASLAVVAVALVAGCGGGPAAEDTSAPTTTSVPSSEASPGTEPASSDASQVARTDGALEVYAAPEDAAPISVLEPTTSFGSPRALLVTASEGDWLEVALPVRPHGTTGWIRRGDVTLRSISESIKIDLDTRTLRLLDGDTEVLTTPVAIGTDANPTPTGRFYVVDKLDTGDPTGPYGQFAFGLSAYSKVLTEFAGGDGQVGIHGTNEPTSIGQAASHGCIRVPNDIAHRLAETINLGTPVTIT
jgi:lipoprotein-anchoring transpeptidase ErfK/SrfK